MTLLPPSIRDERFLTFEQVWDGLLAALELDLLNIYDIDNVEESALIHLADQFNVLGLRGWNLASTVAERRALVKEAIALHRVAGTPYAVRRSMALVGYPDATVVENPPLTLDGSWTLNGDEYLIGKKLGAFIVVLDPEQSEVSTGAIALIVALINEWKNRRSHLIDLRIGDISLFSNLLLLDGSWSLDGDQEIDGEKNL